MSSNAKIRKDEEDSWDSDRLQSLINNQIQEDFRLDYKGLEALPISPVQKTEWDKKRWEIGKDATAFANSDGGVIIYGIREERLTDGRPVPKEFQPIDASLLSREQLTQIIASNSEPTLIGVRVLPIQVPNQSDPGKICYVVIIPQSNTAHMAKDGCYYFRNETTTAKMRDWQVRDAMNRKKFPHFSISGRRKWEIISDSARLYLELAFVNTSEIFARNFRVKITLPKNLCTHHIDHHSWITCEITGANLGKSRGQKFIFSDEETGAFFPGQQIDVHAQLTLSKVSCNVVPEIQNRVLEIVDVEIFADSMPRFSAQMAISEFTPFS